MASAPTIDFSTGNQDLIAVLIDHEHDPKIRIEIRRNAYDFQSWAHVQAWTTEGGWKNIRTLPIEGLDIAEFSYVTRNEDWKVAAKRDLDYLHHWAVDTFFAS